MVAIMLVTLMVMAMMTPTKLAFLLTMLSLYSACASYSMCGSVFFSSAIVISFSSGMMIMLCYTAMMSNFETKNKMSLMASISAGLMASLMMGKKEYSGVMTENSLMSINSMLITLLMLMVVCSMKAINQSVFSPSKSMMSTY